jgi:UDP-N-acetylglucosamine:LPS N-acetylglucosamine transferase
MTDQTSDLRPQPSGQTRPRVLALSSTGGHWIQMLRLQPAFEGCDVTYATTNTDYQSDIENHLFRTIIDANRTQKFKLLLSALSILWTIISVWPDVILSTGAAPGFFAIRIGKLFGKKNDLG